MPVSNGGITTVRQKSRRERSNKQSILDYFPKSSLSFVYVIKGERPPPRETKHAEAAQSPFYSLFTPSLFTQPGAQSPLFAGKLILFGLKVRVKLAGDFFEGEPSEGVFDLNFVFLANFPKFTKKHGSNLVFLYLPIAQARKIANH